MPEKVEKIKKNKNVPYDERSGQKERKRHQNKKKSTNSQSRFTTERHAQQKKATKHPYGTQSKHKKCIALRTQQGAHNATNNHPAVLRTNQLQQQRQITNSAAKVTSWK